MPLDYYVSLDNLPEAIPLRNIKTKTIVKALVKIRTFVGPHLHILGPHLSLHVCFILVLILVSMFLR